MTKPPVNVHQHYHAHVYYDESTSGFAKDLCTEVGNRFALEVGRFHDKSIGPHPMWSCQIKFNSSEFETLVPWLEENRKELTVLIHGLTGNDFLDHTEYAYWLGEEKVLNTEIFKNT